MVKPLPIALSPEALRRQKQRNWAIFSALMAFVVVVFIISIIKMKGGN
jgi:hypothetical protein